MIRLQDLKAGAHIHLLGICGTAMASLAGLLKHRGFRITGSDSQSYPPMSTQLQNLGIEIQIPYSVKNLKPSPDFVIVGNVISRKNEEAEELFRLNLPYASLPQALGELIIADHQSFVVAGTHGKTTTTSILSWVAECLGLQPGFLIGGIPKNFGKSFQNPKKDLFIIEGDEYDTAFFDKVPKFIHYKPKEVILTSIEFDHADIYPNLQAVIDAFAKLMQLIPKDGSLVYAKGDSNIEKILGLCGAKNIFSYGMNDKNPGDYSGELISEDSEQRQFRVFFRGQEILQAWTALSGDYNLMNLTAVVAQCHLQKWDLKKVAAAIESFSGVKRRQEILGEPSGILVIEDFAHHPTAVAQTLMGIKKKYPQRKIFAVFEPRSATSRRKIFQKEYVRAFQAASDILIAPAFDQKSIADTDRFSVDQLIQDLRHDNKEAQSLATDMMVEYLKKNARRNDLILIMSNGGFDGIYQKLLQSLR